MCCVASRGVDCVSVSAYALPAAHSGMAAKGFEPEILEISAR